MSTEDKVRMTLRLTNEENVRLEQYAKANNLTKTGGIRQLLEMALFADEALSMDTDDSALGKLIAEGQVSAVEKLLEATDLAKDKTKYLTPKQSSELINAIGKLRGSTESYKNELNKIGNNINQIAEKLHSTGSLEVPKLTKLILAAIKNWKGMKDLMDNMIVKVERLWHTVQ